MTVANAYRPTFIHVVMVGFAVQVASINQATYFEGLFVQARTAQSHSYDTGMFDVMGDSELQIHTCGSNTTSVSSALRYFKYSFKMFY